MPQPIVFEFHRKDLDTPSALPGAPPPGLFRDALRAAIKLNKAKHSFTKLPEGRFRYTIKEQDETTLNAVLLSVDHTYRVR